MDNFFRWVNYFGTFCFIIGLLISVVGLVIEVFSGKWFILNIGVIVLCSGIVIWIISFVEAAIFGRRRINRRLKKELGSSEEGEIQKIQSAKTGEPTTLKGYGVVGPNGEDSGKRFIRKEDAEKYSKSIR